MLQQDELYSQKIELLLDMHTKKLLEEIGELKKELKAEITRLREDLASIKQATTHTAMNGSANSILQEASTEPTVQQAMTPQQRAQPEAKQRASQEQTAHQEAQTNQKSDKPIDRNRVAPNDVSIEKIFYFGKK